ncbi:MAG TPA: hypothetical protein VMK12_07050 [Anaeromyxobacteraceae bacterium]|nr:hypothetical protein [Anaeromyxobacteraceae bacterium]
MQLDLENQFSNGQVVTANGNSTNVIDQLANRVVGGGGRIYWEAVLKALSGTNPTLQLQLVEADTADLATNPVVLADTGTLNPPALGFLVRQGIPYKTPGKRYLGIVFTIGGTGSPSFTVDSGLAVDVQTSPDT